MSRFAGREGKAVVILARRHFDKNVLQDILSERTSLDLQFCNDVYSKVSLPYSDAKGFAFVDHSSLPAHSCSSKAILYVSHVRPGGQKSP